MATIRLRRTSFPLEGRVRAGAKLDKAQKLGVKIIDEAKLLKPFGNKVQPWLDILASGLLKKRSVKVIDNTRTLVSESKSGSGSTLHLWAKIVVVLGMLFITASSRAQAPSFRWVRQSQGNADVIDNFRSIALDAAGNCYVAGIFESTSPVLTGAKLTNNLTAGACIVKYDSRGNVLWARQPLGTNSGVSGMAVDTAGNCYVTGAFGGITNTIAGTTLSNPTTARYGPWSLFVIKYDAKGNALWAMEAGTSATGINVGTDTNGNTYLSGQYYSTSIQFGGTILTNNLGADSEASYFFLVKLDVSGNVLWATQNGPIIISYGMCMATDAAGNIYFTSDFAGTANFGGITLSNASDSIFAVKYDSNGNALWAEQASGLVGASAIAVDAAGNSYVTGALWSTNVQFGNITLVNSNASGLNQQPFITKYDPLGNALWAVTAQVKGSNGAVGRAITVDGADNVYITGDLDGPSITFDPTTTFTNNYSPYSIPGYAAKYDNAGHFLWAKVFGGEDQETGEAITSDKWGTLYLAGFRTSTNAAFDNIILTNSPSVAGIYVAQIEGPQLSIQTTGNQMAVSWPMNAAGLGLESSSSLNGGGWSPVTNAPVVVGNQNVVTNAVSNSSVFYRLNVQ